MQCWQTSGDLNCVGKTKASRQCAFTSQDIQTCTMIDTILGPPFIFLPLTSIPFRRVTGVFLLSVCSKGCWKSGETLELTNTVNVYSKEKHIDWATESLYSWQWGLKRKASIDQALPDKKDFLIVQRIFEQLHCDFSLKSFWLLHPNFYYYYHHYQQPWQHILKCTDVKNRLSHIIFTLTLLTYAL